MAITASMDPESNQIFYMLDLTFCTQCGSVFPKKAWIILCKTGLDPICMAWSGFGKICLVWQQAGAQESLGPVLAEHNWLATSFPLSDLATFFHRRPIDTIFQVNGPSLRNFQAIQSD